MLSKSNKSNYNIVHGNLKCIDLHLNFGIFLFKQTSDSAEMNNESLKDLLVLKSGVWYIVYMEISDHSQDLRNTKQELYEIKIRQKKKKKKKKEEKK